MQFIYCCWREEREKKKEGEKERVEKNTGRGQKITEPIDATNKCREKRQN